MPSPLISEISALEFGRFRQLIQRVPQNAESGYQPCCEPDEHGVWKAAGLMKARQ
jgi:hypothetical protein